MCTHISGFRLRTTSSIRYRASFTPSTASKTYQPRQSSSASDWPSSPTTPSKRSSTRSASTRSSGASTAPKRTNSCLSLSSYRLPYQEKEHRLQFDLPLILKDRVHFQPAGEDKVLPAGVHLAEEPLLRLLAQKVLYVISEIELSSMEDIIPVLIIIVLMLEVGELRSELDTMVDFISFDPN